MHSKIKKEVLRSNFMFKGKVDNSIQNAILLRSLHVQPRYGDNSGFTQITWVCPHLAKHKCNIDGVTKGTTGEDKFL